jgi:hypothetical protein
MISVLASSADDRGFDRQPAQTKDYAIGICCFFAKFSAPDAPVCLKKLENN